MSVLSVLKMYGAHSWWTPHSYAFINLMLSTQLWISVSRGRLSCSSHGFNSPTEISHFPAQLDWVVEEMDKQPSFSVYQLIPLQTLGTPMVIAISAKKNCGYYSYIQLNIFWVENLVLSILCWTIDMCTISYLFLCVKVSKEFLDVLLHCTKETL